MDTFVHRSTGVQDKEEHIIPGQQERNFAHQEWLQEHREAIMSHQHMIFFIADQQEKGLVNVKYCPTTHMWADPMTKSVQGLSLIHI